MSLAVKIKDLNFRYKGQANPCLSSLNLSIEKGERFGLFGPNGAGKTTLMKLMTGLLKYDRGSIQLIEKEVKLNPRKVKRDFGFIPQNLSYYEDLSPRENLAFFGAWAGLTSRQIKEQTEDLLTVLGLTHVGDHLVKTFSGGMKRRVNLAIGVIHRPPILILDEPTVGVDVQTRHAIISYLKQLNQEGITLIYTSHQLKEAQELCTRIALIDGGQIIASGKLQEILVKHQTASLEDLFLKLTGKAYRDE